MEPLTVALLTTVLHGFVGTTSDAQVALYAPDATIAWVAGTPIALATAETKVVTVPINLTQGVQQEHIRVVTDGVTHELQLTTIGEETASPKWWLPLLALPVVLLSVRVQRVQTIVGSS